MRTVVVPVLTIVVCTISTAAVKYRTFIFNDGEASAVYMRYSGCPGIEADFVKQLQVNDSIRVDATVLHAVTDSAWTQLCNEFNMPELPEPLLRSVRTGKNLIIARQSPRNAPEKSLDNEGKDERVVVTMSPLSHEICVFHTCSYAEVDAVLDRQLNDDIKNVQQYI